MKTNIFIRVRENEFANVKYIKSKIGNFKDKKVLYLGPGDGFYIDTLVFLVGRARSLVDSCSR